MNGTCGPPRQSSPGYNHPVITDVQYEVRMKRVGRSVLLVRPAEPDVTNW
ncbi:hypothetical protein GCM10022207_22220 [Streptomyces lannensis]|uniref:Uncharacterized protein n=1 Tax=Streptomyces lannensis TaxID=766498 RepID=A0ABP7JX86_9ACTN